MEHSQMRRTVRWVFHGARASDVDWTLALFGEVVMSDLIPDKERAAAEIFPEPPLGGPDNRQLARQAGFIRGAQWERGRRVSPVTREALIGAMKAVDSLTVGNKSCSRDGCNHWAGYQDSGSMDWCACHYGADTSECDGQPEPSLPRVERYADAIMSLFPVSPPSEVEWEYGHDCDESREVHGDDESPHNPWGPQPDCKNVTLYRRTPAGPWVPVPESEGKK